MILLAGSVALGQIITLAAAPILTRLYTVEAFGLLAAFTSIVAVVLAIASMRYEMAIPIADDTTAAARLLVVSLILVAATAAVLFVGWVAAGDASFRLLGVPALAPLGWALPMAVLAAGSYQALIFWHVRARRYGTIAATRLNQTVAGAVAQVGLGMAGTGFGGLLFGDIAARSVGLATLLRPAISAISAARVTRANLVASARQHRSFAGAMAVAAVLNTAALHAPFLLFPAGFGLATAGMYFLAHRTLVIPATLVGGSVGQVFFGEAADLRSDPAQLRKLAADVAITLFAFGLPIYGGVFIVGTDLFVVAFGSAWSDAGRFAQLLAPSLLLWSIASPLSSMLVVGRRERESVLFTGAELAARIASIVIGIAMGSPLAAVVLLALSGAVLNLVGIWRFLRPAGVAIQDLMPGVGTITLINVPGFVLLTWLAGRSPAWASVGALAATVALGAGASYLLIVRRRGNASGADQ